MADKLPLKLVDGGSGVGTLAEFAAGDTLPAAQLANAIAALLVGFAAGTNTPVVATNSMLVAIQNLQAQISGLGTGATATVTTSTTDSTVGRLMRVGDFGLSGTALVVANGVDINTIKASGFYSLEAGAWANTPIAGNFYMIVSSSVSSVKQIIFYRGSANIASRFYDINAGTWGAWDYSYTRGNVVGTVSQTSGLVTGTIVETGTNANGTYTKWADGTMICSYTGTTQVPVNTTYISPLFQSSPVTLTFPVAFVGALPRVTPTSSNSKNAVAWGVQQGDITLTGSGIMAISGYNSATTLLGYIAKGRWY